MPMDQEKSPQFISAFPDMQDQGFAYLERRSPQDWPEQFLYYIRVTPGVIVIAPKAEVALSPLKYCFQLQCMRVGFQDGLGPLLPKFFHISQDNQGILEAIVISEGGIIGLLTHPKIIGPIPIPLVMI